MTNFSLTTLGSSVLLCDSNGGILDVITYSQGQRDQAFARVPCGSENVVRTLPTPGAANTAVSGSSTTPFRTGEVAVEPPWFSHVSGVYAEDFNLTLKAAPGTTIYYSLDGSMPRSDIVGNPLPNLNLSRTGDSYYPNTRTQDTTWRNWSVKLQPGRAFVYSAPVPIKTAEVIAQPNYFSRLQWHIYDFDNFYWIRPQATP